MRIWRHISAKSHIYEKTSEIHRSLSPSRPRRISMSISADFRSGSDISDLISPVDYADAAREYLCDILDKLTGTPTKIRCVPIDDGISPIISLFVGHCFLFPISVLAPSSFFFLYSFAFSLFSHLSSSLCVLSVSVSFWYSLWLSVSLSVVLSPLWFLRPPPTRPIFWKSFARPWVIVNFPDSSAHRESNRAIAYFPYR